MVADIKKNGIHEPILCDAEGRIVGDAVGVPGDGLPDAIEALQARGFRYTLR